MPPPSARSGTWAVIIGIDNYPGSGHDLRAAVNDANDVNEALARFGVPNEHRLVLRDGQARASAIRSAIDWLTARAGPDSLAVFFYAGHVRKLGGGSEAMVGADGATVSDADLAGRLKSLRAPQAWIAIAGCYGGGFTETLGPGRILTGAAPANSVAYENSGFKRSYMVQYMVREALIEGRAAGTSVEAAFAYARQELAKDYPNRQPVQYDQASGVIELRTPSADTASGSSPPPKKSGGSAGSGGGGSGGQEPPSEPQDSCKDFTFGIMRCEQGDPHDDGP